MRKGFSLRRKIMIYTLVGWMAFSTTLTGCGKDKETGTTAGTAASTAAANAEVKYSIESIRNEVVGIDQPITLADGTTRAQINFDNAATTPALKAVQNAVNEELNMYGSIGRGYSQKSDHSSQLVEETREKVLKFVGADNGDYTCVFTNSTTDGLNKLASAVIKDKKDIVLTTRMEHHANLLPWRERASVVYADCDEKGRLKYEDIEAQLKSNKVKFVTVTAASNVTGYVNDVHRIAKLAHQYGAKIIVDGAQIVAHREFSMVGATPEENIDFLAFSAHKMYSPYGGGALIGLTEVMNENMPQFYGGGTVNIVADDWQSYKNAPASYEAGSPNYPGIVGLGKAIEILQEVGFDKIQAHEKELNAKLVEGLKKFDNITIYGDSENLDDRVGVVSFNFKDINSHYMAEQLKEVGGVATRRGSFCAHPYVWRLMHIPNDSLGAYEGCEGAFVPGMIRISFGIYNTPEEIDEFLAVVPDSKKKAEKAVSEAETSKPIDPEF